jgi:hypothetical protein
MTQKRGGRRRGRRRMNARRTTARTRGAGGASSERARFVARGSARTKRAGSARERELSERTPTAIALRLGAELHRNMQHSTRSRARPPRQRIRGAARIRRGELRGCRVHRRRRVAKLASRDGARKPGVFSRGHGEDTASRDNACPRSGGGDRSARGARPPREARRRPLQREVGRRSRAQAADAADARVAVCGVPQNHGQSEQARRGRRVA